MGTVRCPLTKSYRGHAPLLPPQHSTAIKQIIKSAATSGGFETNVVTWTIESLDDFVLMHPIFIKIDATCWNPRDQGKLAQHRFLKRVRQLVTKVQEICITKLQEVHVMMDSPGSSTLNIRPELNLPSAESNTFTFLLGLCQPFGSDSSPADHTKVCELAMRKAYQKVFDHHTIEKLGGTLECGIVDRAALQEMLSDDVSKGVVAHNLPGKNKSRAN